MAKSYATIKREQWHDDVIRNALNPEQIRQKCAIEWLERKLREARCNHKCVIVQFSSSAVCAICFRDFGWWCPDSPDHLCKYDWDVGEGCLFCGDPEERK